MASEPARARLLWAILSLVLPVTFRHTTVCRSPALGFSAAIHFAMKRSAPCATVLCHLPLSWAAVVHWSALMPKLRGRLGNTSLFSLPPHAARAPHQLSEHHVLRQSRILHTRHKFREQDSSPAHNRLDALTSHLALLRSPPTPFPLPLRLHHRLSLRSRPRLRPRPRPRSFLPVPRTRLPPRCDVRVQALGLANVAVGCPQAPPPVCRDDDACGMKVPDRVYNLVRFLALLCLSSALSDPVLIPAPVPILVPVPISATALVSVLAPVPVPILFSSTGLHPLLRSRPVRVPAPSALPSPFPPCVLSFASTPVPVPAPSSSPLPSTSPFPPQTPIPPSTPFTPSHPSNPVTPLV